MQAFTLEADGNQLRLLCELAVWQQKNAGGLP